MRTPLYGMIWGQIFCKYGAWGVVRNVFIRGDSVVIWRAVISRLRDFTRWHRTNTCRNESLGNQCLRECMRALYSHSRDYRQYL